MATKRVTFKKAFRLNLHDKMTGVRSQMDFIPGVYDLDEEIFNHWFVQGIMAREQRRTADNEPQIMSTPKPKTVMTAPSGAGAAAQATLAKAVAKAMPKPTGNIPQKKSA